MIGMDGRHSEKACAKVEARNGAEISGLSCHLEIAVNPVVLGVRSSETKQWEASSEFSRICHQIWYRAATYLIIK